MDFIAHRYTGSVPAVTPFCNSTRVFGVVSVEASSATRISASGPALTHLGHHRRQVRRLVTGGDQGELMCKASR